MDTILSYLETMFSKIPNTPETERIKQDLQLNMEEKYEELIAAGKTENEAVGTVISEFGNIDELMTELGYDIGNEQEAQRSLTDQEINEFLHESKHNGKMVGSGVALILFGTSLFMLITGFVFLSDTESRMLDVVGLIPLLILVAVAVGMFIVANHRMEPFKAVLQDYQLTPEQKQRLEQEAFSFRPKQLKSTVIGVILCILAPLFLIIISVIDRSYGTFGVSGLLVLIAIAVYLFVYYGWQQSAYDQLLQNKDYDCSTKDEEDKVISAVAAVVWPLATAIFLITGLVFNQWHINWIIFPVTGLLFGGFAGVRSILNDQ